MTPRPTPAAFANASEDSIVFLAMNGDDAAYGELVRRRQESIRNLLRRLSRSAALADDLAQQVFLSGWHSIRQLKSRAACGAWLRKLAVNAWLAHVRADRRTEPLQADERAAASAVEARMDLDAALAQLKPEVRLCVVLAYNEGLSHAQIAGTLRLPLGTVKSHVTRGAARLRELLDSYRREP